MKKVKVLGLRHFKVVYNFLAGVKYEFCILFLHSSSKIGGKPEKKNKYDIFAKKVTGIYVLLPKRKTILKQFM